MISQKERHVVVNVGVSHGRTCCLDEPRSAEGDTSASIEAVEPVVIPGIAHKEVTEKVIEKALMTQSTSKAPGLDKFNFRIFRMVWQWDSKRIIAMIQNAIRLRYQPKRWKKARGILLEKGGKRDLSLVKSYRVISLLNCMGKIVEKVVAGQLSHYCEKFSKLHPGQMGARKERCAIDAVAALVHKVQECWEEKKVAAALFMDVKGLLIMFQKAS